MYHLATTLASSPLTHGSSQRALEAFLKQLVSLSLQGMSFEDVFAALYAVGDGAENINNNSNNSNGKAKAEAVTDSRATEGSAANTSAAKKQSGLNIARCIAASSAIV